MSLLSRTSAAAMLAVLMTGTLAGPLARPALAQDAAAQVSSDTVLAVVNGTEITLGNLLSVVADLPPQYQQLPDEVLYEGVLEQMIQQLVLAQGFGEPTPAEALALQNQDRAVRAGLAIQRLLKQDINGADLQALYDQMFAEVEPEREYNASHILVATEEEAKAISEELKNGGDFAAIAREKSLDPGSGAAGGELGWFGLGMMVPEFENAVVALQPGQTSEPVQSQFGWHIVHLVDMRTIEQPTLDEMRDQLADQLRNQKVEEAVTAATEAATIDRSGAEALPPATIRRGELLGQ